jgi:hypothetical protein
MCVGKLRTKKQIAECFMVDSDFLLLGEGKNVHVNCSLSDAVCVVEGGDAHEYTCANLRVIIRLCVTVFGFSICVCACLSVCLSVCLCSCQGWVHWGGTLLERN